MNSPQNPSAPSGKDESKTVEFPKKEDSNLNPRDFPSGDEEDRKGGNAGPEEKRHPDSGTPLESISLSKAEENDAADWTRRTPAGTPEKPGRRTRPLTSSGA